MWGNAVICQSNTASQLLCDKSFKNMSVLQNGLHFSSLGIFPDRIASARASEADLGIGTFSNSPVTSFWTWAMGLSLSSDDSKGIGRTRTSRPLEVSSLTVKRDKVMLVYGRTTWELIAGLSIVLLPKSLSRKSGTSFSWRLRRSSTWKT